MLVRSTVKEKKKKKSSHEISKEGKINVYWFCRHTSKALATASVKHLPSMDEIKLWGSSLVEVLDNSLRNLRSNVSVYNNRELLSKKQKWTEKI